MQWVVMTVGRPSACALAAAMKASGDAMPAVEVGHVDPLALEQVADAAEGGAG